MDVVKLISKVDEQGRLNLSIPTQLAGVDVNVVVVVNPISAVKKPQTKYDFSDLVGQLSWQGDEIAMQRNLRDEW